MKNILIVDDREHELFTTLLSRAGKNVHGVASAQEAWRWLETHEVEVIITDLAMPTVDGLTFLEKLNRDRYHIAVLSGYLINGMVEHLLKQLGVERIFEKGTNMEGLVADILEWME